MRRRVLVLLSIIISLTIGCSAPFIDLRETVCIVRDPKDSPAAWFNDSRYHENKEAEVHDIIRNGIRMWFKHLPKAPSVLIMDPDQDNYCSNPDIHVKVVESLDKTTCAKVEYNFTKYSGYIITLSTDCSMDPTSFAHEFGHVIWSFGHILNRFSVMTPTANFYVTPKDMEMMCAEHPEIECSNYIWCKDTFYDKDRCPGPSPDDQVILYKGMYGELWNGQRTL